MIVAEYRDEEVPVAIRDIWADAPYLPEDNGFLFAASHAFAFFRNLRDVVAPEPGILGKLGTLEDGVVGPAKFLRVGVKPSALDEAGKEMTAKASDAGGDTVKLGTIAKGQTLPTDDLKEALLKAWLGAYSAFREHPEPKVTNTDDSRIILDEAPEITEEAYAALLPTPQPQTPIARAMRLCWADDERRLGALPHMAMSEEG